jgi:hypothetical protein
MATKINGHAITNKIKDYAVGFHNDDEDEIVECCDKEDAVDLARFIDVLLGGDAVVLVRHVYMSDWEEAE